MSWNLHVLPEKTLVPIHAGTPTFILVPVGAEGGEDLYGIPDSERAAIKLAERIDRIDPDVVILNEHWQPSGDLSLFKALQGRYPYYVREITDSGRQAASGLGLLSKYPFKQLPNCINGLETRVWGMEPNAGFGKGACYVNTHLYSRAVIAEEVIDPDSL